MQMAAIAGVPVIFLGATLRGAFAPTAEAEELAIWLGSGPDGPPIADALARALGDPTLTLAYWVRERSAFVDATGAPVELPVGGTPRRGVQSVRVGDELVGAIAYDPADTDPRAVAEAAQVVALALRGERLSAELLASQAQLRRSRRRIVRAGDRVRLRIARDLHDGLQGRLVLLGIEAQRLAHAASEAGRTSPSGPRRCAARSTRPPPSCAASPTTSCRSRCWSGGWPARSRISPTACPSRRASTRTPCPPGCRPRAR